MRLAALALLSLVTVGCAHATEGRGPVLSWSDNKTLERIDLSLINSDGGRWCMSAGNWPNEQGKMNFASDLVSLSSRGKVYPLEDFNTGYSTSEIVLRPGQKIIGYLSYKDFALPKEKYASEKDLKFRVVSQRC